MDLACPEVRARGGEARGKRSGGGMRGRLASTSRRGSTGRGWGCVLLVLAIWLGAGVAYDEDDVARHDHHGV